MKRFFAILFAAAVLAGCSDDNTQEYEYDYLTFENVEEKYLAGPTPAGENLYHGYAGDQYIWYSDAVTGLKMGINADPIWEYNFWNGGIAISRWNYMTNDDFLTADLNHCSVYFKALNGNGGHRWSETFGIAHCPSWLVTNPALYFEDGQTERVFDHFWVTNTTYSALTMEDGGFGAKAFNYKDHDWLLLTIEGYNKAGVKTGEVRFYLADFRTAKSGGIVKQWTKVDLSKLGQVNKLEFVISGSDNDEIWGLNTPAYFCFDDVAIRQ